MVGIAERGDAEALGVAGDNKAGDACCRGPNLGSGDFSTEVSRMRKMAPDLTGSMTEQHQRQSDTCSNMTW